MSTGKGSRKRMREEREDTVCKRVKVHQIPEKTTLKDTCTTQWKQLVKRLEGTELEDIKLLCHCTSEERKCEIIEVGKLEGRETTEPSQAPLATTHTVKGVWFIVTIFRGKPLTRSIYGKERIRFPILQLMNNRDKDRYQLFFESTYYYNDKVQYIRMILIDKKDSRKQTLKARKWCEDNLHEVNYKDNPILCYGDGDRYMKVIKNTGRGAAVYVEVQLLGDVPIESIHWDEVEYIDIKAYSRPTFGISPQL